MFQSHNDRQGREFGLIDDDLRDRFYLGVERGKKEGGK